MFSIIGIASLLCLAIAAAVLLFRRRRVGFTGLDNATVSRQWLMEHQTDDRS